MAQLRDKITSECVYEGTPEECVLMAQRIGTDEVMYDDVGQGFDPEAVLSVREAQLEHFEDTSALEATEQGVAEQESQTTDALTAARERVQ